ncbi:MAG: glycosyltransferase family 9 protein [Proteobacteria bacterium]|nr:glycosyltransferase family 9 protein [Pseudomonadota bacterium]
MTFARRLKRRAYAALHPLYRALFPTRVGRGALVGADARRVLVVRNDRIGDLIVTTPVFDVLRELAPGVEVDVLASRGNARLLTHDARVHTVQLHDGSWRGLLALRPALRARRYDAVFSLIPGRSIEQGVAAAFASTPGTVRVSVWRPKRYHGFFTNVVRAPRAVRTGPLTAHLVHVVRAAFGAPVGGAVPRPAIAVPPESERAVDAFVASHALGTFAVVNVWSAAAARSWDVAGCASALDTLAARFATLRFVLVPSPANAADAERVRALAPAARVLVYPPEAPLLELAALVRRAALVITPNTMTLHLAVAMGRPVVWLDTTADRNDPALWRPAGVPERGLVADDGAPVSAITGDQVARAVESLIGEAGIVV